MNNHTHQRDGLEVGYGSIDSPVGRLLVAATPAGVVRIGFECEPEERVLGELARRLSARVTKDPSAVESACRQLEAYFTGDRRSFDFALDRRLTAGFSARVLRATEAIPYGETSTYRTLAAAAGSPAAVRAAGSALAGNPLPIVVACHRVLRSDGGLGGFRGGLPAKRALLDHEAGLRALAA